MTKYTKADKEKAVALAKKIGVKAAAKQLNTSHQNVSRWVKQEEQTGEIPDRDRGRPSYPAIIEELNAITEKLRKENASLARQAQKWKDAYIALSRLVNDE